MAAERWKLKKKKKVNGKVEMKNRVTEMKNVFNGLIS